MVSMETAHIAHDLFLLMLNLSQIREKQRIMSVFVEAVNTFWEGVRLREVDKSGGYPDAEEIAIATVHHDFGRLAIECEAGCALCSEGRSLLRNAVGMLAIILENRLRGEILSDEKRRLETRVRAGAEELIAVNAALAAELAERKRAEAERSRLEARIRHAQKMEAIGTLAGGIAHDFNNILSPILGYAELTLDDLAPETEAHQNLRRIIQAAERARSLVNRILSFSREVDGEPRPVDLASAVKEVIKLLRATLPATIEIQREIDPGAGAVHADPVQIHQVVMNLCTNAFHAMRENGGTLSISLSAVDLDPDDLIPSTEATPGTYLRLTVRDTGVGMSAEVLDQVFIPYFTTRGGAGGTGLGLSVVHGIVEHLGGVIKVYSEPGRGTAFHVYLPTTEASPRRTGRATVDTVPRGDERVLLVDDEPETVMVLDRMLRRLGYRVTATTDPREALARFREAPDAFDLVLTDTTMPHLTGVVLSRKILRVRPEMPIILCTGFSELITEDQARSIGVRAFLMKPLMTADLARTVREVLDEPPPTGTKDLRGFQ